MFAMILKKNDKYTELRNENVFRQYFVSEGVEETCWNTLIHSMCFRYKCNYR
ncbi:uncharacterized protein MELLADRAFT_52802 [Melampsora larici-populina 98AG31]|uniref:Uncharacterized protein n=1 Tax=Melampsora larici-populina (strain 98AG31 / pathotype 3-4-7) TaxID=747676 RepID=F4RQ15_MELLP|nr:uncharacterized protein MELLADRAFT_52802 [Melampsora larici-populina 98AG31]EGG05483.1 hypothetical protein MELLADRAFT_52802 [Melampsora larici-populina 98AG31]